MSHKYIGIEVFLRNTDFSSRIVPDPAQCRPPYEASALPKRMTFGSVQVGEQSPAQTAIIRNIGRFPLTFRDVQTVGPYLVSHNQMVHTLNPGEFFEISVIFNPGAVGLYTGAVVIHFGPPDQTYVIEMLGYGKGEGAVTPPPATALPRISISNGILETATTEPDPDTEVPDETTTAATLSAMTLNYTETNVGTQATAQSVLLTNTGTTEVSISSLLTSGDFMLASESDQVGTVIPVDGAATLSVIFLPTAGGTRLGTLSIESSAGTFMVSLTGSAVVPLSRLYIQGADIKRVSDDSVIQLQSVNWFGAESANHTPHGTWADTRHWRDIVDQIHSMGFNCIRLPVSGAFSSVTLTPPSTAIDETLNPDLVGLNAWQILDKIFDYCESKGIYVVIDHHRRQAGAGADGGPTDGSYTLANWKATWANFANRYKNHLAVIGADLHNEPHNLTWADWAVLAEDVGNHVLSLAPDWLIFVEGVGNEGDDHYWWAGHLKGVATRPIVLSVPNKVVYSPHEYGQSVGSQTWLAYDGGTVPENYPNNLPPLWDAYWGFIAKQGIAPIWIGEFGGFFGRDGIGGTKPHGTYETQWGNTLVSYLKTNNMSFAYWAYNPNSVDTGGLVRDDWTTPQTHKLTLLQPVLAD